MKECPMNTMQFMKNYIEVTDRENNLYINTLKLNMISLAMYIILKPWENPLINFVGYAIILSSYFLPVSAFLDYKKRKIDVEFDALLVLGLICTVFFSIVLSIKENGIDFDLLISVLSFISMYIAIVIEPRCYSVKDVEQIFIISKILSIVLVMYTLLPFPFRYTLVNEWGYYAFTLSLGNTNATAIQVFFCIAMLLVELYHLSSKIRRAINWGLIAGLFYTIYLLQCRTIMLCGAIITLMVVINRIPLHRVYVDVGIAIPIFSILAQILIKNDDITILGKGIVTGRGVFFIRMINTILQNPLDYLFGLICKHRLNNYHNGPLTVLMNTGIVGLAIILGIWGYSLKKSINDNKTGVQKVAILALIAYLIHSSTEAAPMIGMILYGTPVIVLFRLSKDQFNDDLIVSNSLKNNNYKHKYLQ